MTKPIRILIADDHDVVRSGLRALLERTEGFTVVAEGANGEEAVRLANELKPNVAILDISMPVMNGVDAARSIKRDQPDVHILMLTIHENEEYVRMAMGAGADGYILKNADREELRSAVQAVNKGHRFFSAAIADRMSGNGSPTDKGP